MTPPTQSDADDDRSPTPRRSFPSSCRLVGKADFDAVFQGDDRRRTKGRFVVMYSQPNRLDRPRLGLVVPKRQARRAVDRNLVKRLARESFRHRQAEIGGFDLIVQLTRLGERSGMRDDLGLIWDRFIETDRHQAPSRGRQKDRRR